MSDPSFYFYKTSSESIKRAQEAKDNLRELLNTYGKMLSFDTKDFCRSMLIGAGESGTKKAIARLRREVKKLKENPQAYNADMCLIMVGGNTYPHYNTFKEYAFKNRKIGNTWFSVKEIHADKFAYWSEAIRGMDSELAVMKADNLEEGAEKYQELMKEVKAEKIEQEIEDNANHEMNEKVVEVKAWFARILQEKTGAPIKFRNLKIKRVYRETQKAYLVDLEFFSGILKNCGVCGRGLTNDISRMTGIGPICASKLGMERPDEKNAKEFMKELDDKFKKLGVFKEIWLPKSQIKLTDSV